MNRPPKILTFLSILSSILFLLALGLVLFFTPLEAKMNYVQKVFYFHLSSAWVGMLGFICAAISGIAYLVSQDMKWDIIEVASVEISLVFFLNAIVSGSIWAKPSWGTWWTWDPRLTTAAILEMIYVAYILLRQGIDDPERRARFSAVYTLVGGLSVPVTFLSIRLWQSIHPAIIVTQGTEGGSSFGMTPAMLFTMIFSILTFTFIFVTLLWHRIRIGHLAVLVAELRNQENEEMQS